METTETLQSRYEEQNSYNIPPVPLDICLARAEPMHSKTNSEMSLNALNIDSNLSRVRYEQEPMRVRSASSSPRATPAIQRSVESNVKSSTLLVPNSTIEEKPKRPIEPLKFDVTHLADRPYFEALIKALDCTESDQRCFYTLCIFLTMTMNPAVDNAILESVGLTVKSSDKSSYNTILIDRLCNILLRAASSDGNVRLVTLNLTINLLKKLVYNEDEKMSYLSDHDLARIEQAYEQSMDDLRRHYRLQQEIFLDIFEDEYRQMQLNPIRLEYLLKDACMLYAPATTPIGGIDFTKRLPSGDVETARRSIRVFLLIRALSFEMRSTTETELPLTKPEDLVSEDDKLDLNNSDLVACTVCIQEKKDRRYLVTCPMQIILIEPDVKKLGWGIVKFCDLIQDVKVANDKEDTRSLHITIHKPVNSTNTKSNTPIFNAKFTFDDHIRCVTAKQTLNKGRQRARQIKLAKIASILDIPLTTNQSNNMTSPRTTYSQHQLGLSAVALLNHPGRAALLSSSSRQLVNQNSPINNSRVNTSTTTTTASSPSFITIEHNESNSSSNNDVVTSNGRQASAMDINERSRRDSNKSIQTQTAPKSLREWHEQPVNLSEQPPLSGKVQILSPTSDQTSTRFFVDGDLATLVMLNGESLKDDETIITTRVMHHSSTDKENE